MRNLIILLTLINSLNFFAQGWELQLKSTVEMRTWKLTTKAESELNPLPGATIKLLKGNTVVKQMTSDANGDFLIGVPPNEEFILEVSYPGCNTKRAFVTTKNVPDFGEVFFSPSFGIGGFIMAKPFPGIDYSGLQQPMVKVAYSPKVKNFDDDELYTQQSLGVVGKISGDENTLIQNFCNTNKQGDEALKKPDCPLAKTLYEKAMALIPGEQYPVVQLKKVGECLKEKELAEAKAKAEAEAKAKAEADKLAKQKDAEEKAKAEAEAKAKAKAEADKLAKQKDAEEKAKAEAEAKAKAEAEAKAKAEADKLAKQKDAEEKAKAEAEAKTKAEAEAKAKAEAEAKAKAEADKLAKQKDAEEKAKAEAEAKTKAEADKLAKQKDAEEKAKTEAEAKTKAEAEAKTKAEADKLAKQKELELKAKKEAEAKAKADAERIAKENQIKTTQAVDTYTTSTIKENSTTTTTITTTVTTTVTTTGFGELNVKTETPVQTTEPVVKTENKSPDNKIPEKDNGFKVKKYHSSGEHATDVKQGNETHRVRVELGSDKYNEAIKKGDTAMDAKQYTQAIDYYKEALKLKPKDVYAKTRLEEAQKNQK